MAEKLTSPEEAAQMGAIIKQCVNDMEAQGFGRGEIGACMAGIGLALAQVHSGHEIAMSVIHTMSDLLAADTQPRQ